MDIVEHATFGNSVNCSNICLQIDLPKSIASNLICGIFDKYKSRSIILKYLKFQTLMTINSNNNLKGTIIFGPTRLR